MTGEETARTDPSDELLRELRHLRASPAPRAQAVARAAFTRAFEPVRWYERPMTFVSRTSVPVALAGVVVIYLSWAFAAASALMH